jgi:protein phosphatase
MRLVSGAATDKGLVRDGNEDAYVVDPRLRLFAIADGMGGHQAGEVASATAIEALRAAIASGLAVGEGVMRANTAVFEKAADDDALTGMGTTITALVPDGEQITIGHVGDSRAYLLRNGELRQLTDDHSLVGELVREGRLTEEQAAVHPQRSIITRTIGVDPDVEVDVTILSLVGGDRVLLCSDGLTDMLRPDEIATIMRREADPTACANALVDAANAAGGVDNTTAVIVDVVDDEPAAGTPPAAADAVTAVTTVTTDDGSNGAAARTPEADPPANAAPSAASPAEAPEASEPSPSRRERRADRHVGRTALRVAWFAIPILLIVGLGVAAVAWYARNTYFVAFAGDRVVVYQGRPGGLLLWDPTVARRTELRRADLSESAQLAVENQKEFSTRGDAVDFVLRNEARTRASTTTTTVPPSTPVVPTPQPTPTPTP